MGERRRKHWGWGYEDEQPGPDELRATAAGLADHLGFGEREPELPVALEDVALAPPRLETPFAQDTWSRAAHAQGRSYLDVVRGLRGEFPHPPDGVAFPASEDELRAVLDWCGEHKVAVVPVGGGTSVVGGIDAIPGSGHQGVVAVNLRALDRVLEVDPVSRAARIQAGATGPGLERRLAEHGLTMRFYPQSFELSTLGGWIATRAGGHFATGRTHVDDLVESVRALTVAGDVWESRRLPASGAGPSPDRMLLGSEGTLAVITEAWVRVLPRPERRRSASVSFRDFASGLEAVRELVQAGLRPANCRLLEPEEAKLTMAGDGSRALLVLGFEEVVEPADRAFELCRAHGGEVSEGRGGGSGAWREAFLRAPYLRDSFAGMGVLSETFETAITWERLPAFVEQVKGAAAAALGEGLVTCRLTHAYPDGAAPYFTVLGPVRRGEEAERWGRVKAAASEAILAAGGTVTHHHAVGRDHRPYYDRQRPDPFASALRAAKAALDPRALLNPGVLFDPR
ncbi:MAG: alkyldihydroxyacetonephosphate synthase [Solirubrobacteraceae bacterium]|nr:alkyldihydroxyacetonephosphate synthase [Solirubrobacteraceae bacterium]